MAEAFKLCREIVSKPVLTESELQDHKETIDAVKAKEIEPNINACAAALLPGDVISTVKLEYFERCIGLVRAALAILNDNPGGPPDRCHAEVPCPHVRMVGLLAGHCAEAVGLP